MDQCWFFIFDIKIFDLIEKKNIVLEKKPLEKLVKMKHLVSYKHKVFGNVVIIKKIMIYFANFLKKENQLVNIN